MWGDMQPKACRRGCEAELRGPACVSVCVCSRPGRLACQRNSRVRRKGVGCLNSQRTTLHHWLSLIGRSRWEWIQLRKAGYMMVSEVGLR